MGKKGVTTFVFIYVKITKVKISDIAYIRLLPVRTDQCKYLRLGFIPDGNPKGVTKRGNTIDMYLRKKAMLKPVLAGLGWGFRPKITL